MAKKTKMSLILFAISYIVALVVFFFKYVPLVNNFLLALVPLLFIVFILTAFKVKWGILFFVFFFPLINNLPYFFGIFKEIPQASTALLLFLFFFLGWLVHIIIYKPDLNFKPPIFKPMVIFAVLIFVSGIITILRYANFYPFVSDYVYELITNTNGVTAGGALMSTIFFSLNYITGLTFFFVIINSVKSKEFVKKIILFLLISTLISLFFGFYQHFIDIKVGNTPLRVMQNTINATFKDSLSFGAYLSMIAALCLGMVLALKKMIRIIPIVILIFALYVMPFTESLSGMFGFAVSSLFFLLFLIKIAVSYKKSNPTTFKKTITYIGVLSLVIIIALSFSILKDFKSFGKIKRRIALAEKDGLGEAFFSGRLNYFWEMAGYMLKEYPLTGVGIGAYIIELPNYAKIHNKTSRTTDSAENYFFQVSSELGIIGLLFSVWIFWEIIKQIKVSISGDILSNRWRYFKIGISCGIISLFTTFFVHTYIGNYEIKYAFWLLVGLLYVLGRSKKEAEDSIHFKKHFKLLCMVLIFLFGCVHLWNSTHSLSLKSRTEKIGLEQNFGLYKKEKIEDGREFTWTKKYGGLMVKIEKSVVRIPMHASHPDIKENPVTVKIYLVKKLFEQKTLLAKIVFIDHKWRTYEYYLPEEVGQKVILLVEVSRTWNPLKYTGAHDPRNLGVALGEIEF